jgi:hypothetical protein
MKQKNEIIDKLKIIIEGIALGNVANYTIETN